MTRVKRADGRLPFNEPELQTPPPAPKADFRYIIPLEEIIGQVMKRGVNTKGVRGAYMKAVEGIGPEFHVLLHAKLGDIESVCGEGVAHAIGSMRRGEVSVTPGYDGLYGKVEV